MPLLGAHMSIAGGYHNAPEAAAALGMDTVQVFTKSNAQWNAKPLTDDDAAKFRESVERHGLRRNCSHASYLINLAAAKPDLLERSVGAMAVEIERAGRLGLDGVVLHPGAHTTDSREVGVDRVVASLDRVLKLTEACGTEIWLEATAGQGSCLGCDFAELAAMIERTERSDRLGVCIDTCHIFAAGYDITTQPTYEATVAALAESVGLDRIRAFHLNDSKHPLGSRKDRHEHIGEGHLGLEAFRLVLNDERFAELPMFLETKKELRDEVEMDAVNLRTLRGLIA